MITNKHAQGHVEIIFSFVIFISFLSFLLIAFNPFKTTSNTETYLNLAQNQIEKLITKEVSLLTLNINSNTFVPGCYYFEYEYTGEGNIITKDSAVKVPSKHETVESNYKISIDFSANKFYYIYFSKDFVETGSSCTTILDPSNYTLGLLRTYNVVSMKQINENLSIEYNTNYNNLKKKIGIPETKDFSLNFYDLTRTSIKELGTPPEKVVIYAREIPVQFMYPDGEFKYGFMQIRIW